MNVRFVGELLKGLRHLLLPGVCFACHQPLTPDGNDFCCHCSQLFAVETVETCPRCSSTVGPYSDLTDGCSQCRGQPFAFRHAVRLGPYEGRLRELVLRLKQPGQEMLAEAVGERWSKLLLPRVQAMRPDVVIPVPLHWRRRWWRGFNQSELLAQGWAKQLGVPSRPQWLKRVRHTPRQALLTATARRENVRGAFQAARNSELRGRTVLLIDDVLTTGGTAHESARALKDAGAREVNVAVLAHGR